MLHEVREQMKEQQVQSDREREHMALDHEHVLQEQEKLRLLNKQLLAQVVALQSNPVQMGATLITTRLPTSTPMMN